MAKTDKKEAAESTAKPRRKMGFKYKLLLIVSTLLIMAFLRIGFVFYLVGMLPSIIAYYLDQSQHRYSFKTIFCCNLSGMLPFLARMFYYGPTSTTLQETTGNFYTWMIVFGAAGIGIMINAIGPMIARSMICKLHESQVARLQRSQKKIESEWGREVTQFGLADEAKN